MGFEKQKQGLRKCNRTTFTKEPFFLSKHEFLVRLIRLFDRNLRVYQTYDKKPQPKQFVTQKKKSYMPSVLTPLPLLSAV